MDDQTNLSLCECNWTQNAVTNEMFPITFDEEMEEFQLVLDCGNRGKGSAVLRHCASCGGALPKSKRGTFFTVPSDADKTDVQDTMKTVNSVEQMRELLGEPTDTHQGQRINEFTYDNSWESLELIVREYEDGHLEHGIIGRFKGEPRWPIQTR